MATIGCELILTKLQEEDIITFIFQMKDLNFNKVK